MSFWIVIGRCGLSIFLFNPPSFVYRLLVYLNFSAKQLVYPKNGPGPKKPLDAFHLSSRLSLAYPHLLLFT